jgi:hypothetical protein
MDSLSSPARFGFTLARPLFPTEAHLFIIAIARRPTLACEITDVIVIPWKVSLEPARA